MNSYAWYGLQVIICSGIMMVYYWCVLRNKRFHQYNRFYILASVFLSFLIPFIKIQVESRMAQKGVGHLIYVFADYNASMENAIDIRRIEVNWYIVSLAFYVLIGVYVLLRFIIAIIKIQRLIKACPTTRIDDVSLVLTNAAGTPFSFFKFVFWNSEIDIQSVSGQQILKHELIHVKEKHSIDTVIMQLVLTAGWINPFFWLANKELNMIHEFAADSESVKSGDTASFAAMLLMTAYPGQQYLLTHTFFFSPIKRRLLMLTINKNPRYSYVRRIIALPLIALIVILFAFKAEHRHHDNLRLHSNNSVVSAPLSDTLIIRDSAGVLKGRKANIAIVDNASGGRDTVITIMGGNVTKSHLASGIANKSNPIVLRDMYAEPKPLYIVDGKIAEDGLASMNPDDISSIDIFKRDTSIAKYGEAGKNGVVIITSKQLNKPLYIVDGKIMYGDGIKDIPHDEISSVNVLKGDTAIVKYGDKGKNGVVIITTKKK